MGEEIMKYIKTYCSFSGIRLGENKEDVMQDMAVNVLSSLKNYDSDKGNLRNYIYGICQNTERKYLRNLYREMDKIPCHIENTLFELNEGVKEDIYFEDYYGKEIIEKAISLIEKENLKRCRKVSTENMYEYAIMYIQGYTQGEIAKVFNTTQRSVFLRLNYFKQALSKMYNIE